VTGLRADCSRCFGLCCVAPAFAKSADFGYTKPAGKPCRNLQDDFRCAIHSTLRQKGFPGCQVYDCFGAGQHVSEGTFAGESWRDQPDSGARMFEAFGVVRQLHELLWLLEQARALDAAKPLAAEIAAARLETSRLADGDADSLCALDVTAQRAAVNPLLRRASELARTPFDGANLRGASLLGADLRGERLRMADVTGADMRAADVRGADLSETLFLSQAQIDSMTGDDSTRLPPGARRPAHWRP
jgi:uncharacterized protein YjbI with pentapeptide repeats